MIDTDMTRLPCGCVIGNKGQAFVMRPCKPDCENWLYAKARAKERGKPIQAIDPTEIMVAQTALANPMRCPFCAVEVDTVSGREGKTADPGSVLVCIKCAKPGIVTRDYTIRKPTPDERATIEMDGDFILMRDAIRKMHRERLAEN